MLPIYLWYTSHFNCYSIMFNVRRFIFAGRFSIFILVVKIACSMGIIVLKEFEPHGTTAQTA